MSVYGSLIQEGLDDLEFKKKKLGDNFLEENDVFRFKEDGPICIVIKTEYDPRSGHYVYYRTVEGGKLSVGARHFQQIKVQFLDQYMDEGQESIEPIRVIKIGKARIAYEISQFNGDNLIVTM